MRLKNVLIVVEDMEISKTFYREIMGLHVIMDQGDNVMLTEGLVLQQKKVWEDYMGQSVSKSGFETELYFVENNLDQFLERIDSSDIKIERVGEMKTNFCGRRTIHILDPDGHLIEIGEH